MEKDDFFSYIWTFNKTKAKENGCDFPDELVDFLNGKSVLACAPQGLTLMTVVAGWIVLINDRWCDVREAGE